MQHILYSYLCKKSRKRWSPVYKHHSQAFRPSYTQDGVTENKHLFIYSNLEWTVSLACKFLSVGGNQSTNTYCRVENKLYTQKRVNWDFIWLIYALNFFLLWENSASQQCIVHFILSYHSTCMHSNSLKFTYIHHSHLWRDLSSNSNTAALMLHLLAYVIIWSVYFFFLCGVLWQALDQELDINMFTKK